ncbi:MAG: CoB--CoM heterodisulfide reductase iron-sulfur subunit B family protein, partial [Desulfatiglandales bacterium]
MELAYYPGCSLEGTANDYGRSVVEAFGLLGIKLREIPDWTCCGSTAAHSLSEAMTVLLPSKNISIAEEMGLDLLAPCPMCYNRLVHSLDRIKRGLEDPPWPLTGQVSIHDPTRFLSQQEFLRGIREGVKRPLKDLRVVCYYGCQMVRPPKLTGFKDFQNPTTMDKILTELGATVLDWSYKTICCGASIKMGRKEIGLSLSFKLLMKAVEFGADAIIVSCPL